MGRKKHPLIGIKPGGTSPAIAGTRIRVVHIVRIRQELETDEAAVTQALAEMPHLTSEQVQAAIDYWRDNFDEIQAEISYDDKVYEGSVVAAEKGRSLPPIP